MSVVTGALGSLAPKLLQLLHGEYKLQKGVRKQVESLCRQLDSIKPFLHKVSDVPWNQLDEQVKVWAREVREASYDMEDILDTFLVSGDSGKHADSSSLMNKMGELFSKAKARRDIAGKIQDMTKRLEEVAGRRQRYKLDEIMYKHGTSTLSIDPRLKAMHKELTQLIGVDNSKDELISMLNPSEPDLTVSDKKMKKVSIVGVGGLGKTTLAKVVYDKLKSQYDCAAFVSVGHDYNWEKVFKDILFDLDKVKYKDIHDTRRGLELLIREVREFLENKRYFVAIDDVWKVETWETIKIALVENNCGSTVITTTRKFDVAQEAGEVYKLKPLSWEDSTKLLYTRIFGADRKYFDSQTNDVSNKILKKCAGIPLAIITMASLFASKPECQWSEVNNCFGSEGNLEVEDTMTIISFSYYDLHPHLRTCLLYLCTYPEDYVIKKDSLIRKWIGEGFIHGDQGTRLFDLGERYFNDLINRSLIQVVEDEIDGTISGCRVHDMVLDLMRKLSSEENFISVFGDNVEGTPIPSNVRRLAYQNRIAECINSEALVSGMPTVRSYTIFMCFIDGRDLFLRFKHLRVLDIIDYNFKEGCRLEHLGDLLQLRYLGITSEASDELELPKHIGNLKLLQTLDVQGPLLPASIVHLTQLVWLRANKMVPDGIGKLVSLEELIILKGSSDNPKRFLKEISNLRELRVLRFAIRGMDESMQRDFVESLTNLQKIKHIEMHGPPWGVDTTMWEGAGFVLPGPLHYVQWNINFSKFPSSINQSRLPNLSPMTIWANSMDEQDLKLLARLPALCFLFLGTKSTVTASNSDVGDGCFFPKLRYFLTKVMVQFEQPDEEGASVTLHMWNGIDAMPFASRKNNDSRKVVPSSMMSNLEVLDFDVPLRALKDKNGDCGNIGLQCLPSLQKLKGYIYCEDVTVAESDAALAELRNACKLHPNDPTLHMKKINKLKMVSTHDKEYEKQREEEEEEASQTADILGRLSLASS